MDFLVKMAFLSVSAVFGAAAGWWIRGGSKNLASREGDASETSAADFSTVDAVMAQLQQLTASMAADVGEHNTRVKAINEELTAAGGGANVIAIVKRLVSANETMQAQLMQAEERLQLQAQEIEAHVREARTDALTKTWNRRHFDDEMKRCVDVFQKSERPSCVMMLDVDHFKKFNDTYGHQAGDEVLRGVARTLRRHTGPTDIVCRYGGEEFGIIFPGCDVETAKQTAERARSAIAEQVFEFEGLELKVTASAGLGQLRPAETPDELIKRADEALYVSKEAGRNCGHWHDGSTSHRIEAPKPKPRPEPTVKMEPVPGVSTRESFDADVERRLAELKRGDSSLSVLFVEVDDYDDLREAYGDNACAVVLRAAAQFLKATMREMDHIAQYDERVFGLLLPAAGMPAAKSVAERLRTAVARCELPVGDKKLCFTVSIGATEATSGDRGEDVLARAQASLEAARESGGNCSFATLASGEVRSMALSS